MRQPPAARPQRRDTLPLRVPDFESQVRSDSLGTGEVRFPAIDQRWPATQRAVGLEQAGSIGLLDLGTMFVGSGQLQH